MKYSEIIEINNAIVGFEKTEATIPTSVVLSLLKIKRLVKPHIEDYQAALKSLNIRFGESENGRNYIIKKENVIEYDKEVKVLNETEPEFKYTRIKKSELRGTMENIRVFEGMMAFFEHIIEE